MTAPLHGLRTETDPDIVRSFLSDAAHVPGGFAAGVVAPRSLDEVIQVVRSASTLLPVGAQSSLTGGATPRGELVLSTRGLSDIAVDEERRLVRVGAGVALSTLQSTLATSGLWYPPAPTFDGASVGGTVATNAAGAATFKYGTTRDWVAGLTVVLADGQPLSLHRGQVVASHDDLSWKMASGTVHVPLPGYTMPAVPKLSAGYYSRPAMDLVDLFVGSEGTLGVVVDITLRVIPRPARCVALLTCADDAQAVHLTGVLRAAAARRLLDVSAVEYMDSSSLAFLPDAAFARAGTGRPSARESLVLLQLEVPGSLDATLDALADAILAAGVAADPVVAQPGDHAAAQRLFELREAVPAAVNAAVAAAQITDPELQKTAGDFIVPFERLDASIALYRRACESRGLSYAIWGHVSDGNLHPNIIPRSRPEMERGRDALVEMARTSIAVGGAPMAEHGVGRNALKQQLLRELYGEEGIEQMRAVKRTLDPTWKLSPGVIFPRTTATRVLPD